MKPHERTLKWNPNTHSLEIVTAGLGVTGLVAMNVHPEDAPLLEAAPDMARALLTVLRREDGSDLRFTLGQGALDDIRAALKKAGVPLP